MSSRKVGRLEKTIYDYDDEDGGDDDDDTAQSSLSPFTVTHSRKVRKCACAFSPVVVYVDTCVWVLACTRAPMTLFECVCVCVCKDA